MVTVRMAISLSGPAAGSRHDVQHVFRSYSKGVISGEAKCRKLGR